MGIFNLDEKLGIFKGSKKISKMLSKGMLLLMDHYRYTSDLKIEVTDVSDSTLGLLVLEELAPSIARGDFIVLSTIDNDFYLTATVKSMIGRYPFEFLAEINKIETISSAQKSGKFDVSIQGSLKILGIGDNIPAIVKRISMDAIKLSSREDIAMNEIVLVTVILNVKNKILARCKVVRKEKFEDFNDYGLEITDLSEENKRNWYRLITEKTV